MRRPTGVIGFLLIATAGAAVSVVMLVLGIVLPLGDLPQAWAWDLLTLGLTLTGFLLVPASVFVVAVGAMFPNYDRATPVSLVSGWASPVLRILTFTLALGLTTATAAAFNVPVSGLTLLTFVVLVVVGLLAAIWLIEASLAILDPDRLTQTIADRVVRPTALGPLGRPDIKTVNEAFNDLCRLVRGFADRRRPTAAANALDRLAEVWAACEPHVGQRPRELAARVLGECAARRHPELDAAICLFTARTGIKLDKCAYRRLRRDLRREARS